MGNDQICFAGYSPYGVYWSKIRPMIELEYASASWFEPFTAALITIILLAEII